MTEINKSNVFRSHEGRPFVDETWTFQTEPEGPAIKWVLFCNEKGIKAGVAPNHETAQKEMKIIQKRVILAQTFIELLRLHDASPEHVTKAEHIRILGWITGDSAEVLDLMVDVTPGKMLTVAGNLVWESQRSTAEEGKPVSCKESAQRILGEAAETPL